MEGRLVVDTSRLSRGEKIAGATAAALVLASFFPFWARYEATLEGFGDATSRFSVWSDAIGLPVKLAIILALAAAALVAARAAGATLDLPRSAGEILLALGALVTVLLLIGLATGPVGEQVSLRALGATFEYGRGFLLLIGWLLGVGIAYGGYLHLQEERGTPAPPDETAPPPGAP